MLDRLDEGDAATPPDSCSWQTSQTHAGPLHLDASKHTLGEKVRETTPGPGPRAAFRRPFRQSRSCWCTGAFLAAADEQVPVVVDGFIATVAAYAATRINPECREFMIFGHQSHESGHKHLLSLMEATPLLDLSLRLGEGTGAVLSVPLLRAAAEFYNNMASFEEAGVVVD